MTLEQIQKEKFLLSQKDRWSTEDYERDSELHKLWVQALKETR
jgi:hypothetical protein